MAISQPQSSQWRHLERLRNQWLAAQEEAARLATDHTAMEEKLAEALRQPPIRQATPRIKSSPPARPSVATPSPRPQACRPDSKGLRVTLAVYKPGWVRREPYAVDVPTISELDARLRAERQARRDGWLVAYRIDTQPIPHH